jgi:hypothetical protein
MLCLNTHSDIGEDRYWHLADIPLTSINVRFRGKADIASTCVNVR